MNEIVNKIIQYFKKEKDVFIECIEELDDCNGILGSSRYYEMKQINEIFKSKTASNILKRAFYGHDKDSWSEGLFGERCYDKFNPTRKYWTLDAHKNLVSSNYKDYSWLLQDCIIMEMNENRTWMSCIDFNGDLSELFDELQEYLESEEYFEEKHNMEN